MKKFLWAILLLLLIFWSTGCALEETQLTNQAGQSVVLAEPDLGEETYIVGEDDIFASIMDNFGIDYREMLEIVDTASTTFDFTHVRIGQPFHIVRDEAGKISYFDYEINKDKYVRVSLEAGRIKVEEKPIDYRVEVVKQWVTVSSSLYVDGLAASVPEEIIMEFAEVFAWTIDFAVQVQRGDRFEVIYERRYREGQPAGTGKILAGRFINAGQDFRAYLFEDAEGEPAYYSQVGEAMVKQFLRAPLNYSRITSGYTYARFHPVIQRNTPHLAIDYAAAIGTPVMAVGDGIVTYAGWNGGFGNYIDIRHNDMYSTQYAHLSAYARGLRAGTPVKQGQVIGFVGSTGWSTGPHLHYQIKKYGSLVNPLTIELPPGDPVPEEKLADFNKVKDYYNELF